LWFRMGDDTVNEVPIHTVLSQQAYLLFYVRDDVSSVNEQPDAFSASISPLLDGQMISISKMKGGKLPKPCLNATSQSSTNAINDEIDIGERVDRMPVTGRSVIDASPQAATEKPAAIRACPMKRRKHSQEDESLDTIFSGAPAKPHVSVKQSSGVNESAQCTYRMREALGLRTTEVIASQVAEASALESILPAPVVEWNESVESKRAKLVQLLQREDRHRHDEGALNDRIANTCATNDAAQHLGKPVPSWSIVDMELFSGRQRVLGLKQRNKRGHTTDAYDAEYDRGRVRKVRKTRRPTSVSGNWIVIEANELQKAYDAIHRQM